MVLQKPREIAAQILLQHAEGRGFLEDVLQRRLTGVRLPPPDRALVQEICYGTLRWQATLDWLIERQARNERPNPQAMVFLRLGLYQLFWLDRVPPHAALNETVEAARALDFGGLAGFINAVLRAYTRTFDSTKLQLQELRTREPAIGWSHPKWIIDRWQARYSPEELQALLAWNNTPAVPYARVNTLRSDPAAIINAWRTEGVDYDFARFDWTAENQIFRLRHHPPLEKLKSFQDGWFYIQDPSTLLAVHLLAPQPGENIVDVCAAPGGKATLIAQSLDNDGSVTALEADASRRQKLAENCERLGADVTVLATDHLDARGPFDAALVDAPCSNTGVFRRRLDARWRLHPGEINRTQRLQQSILLDAAAKVRVGGRIIYSTCSIEPEENEQVVAQVLERSSGLRLVRSRSLLPFKDGVDGAFVAELAVESRFIVRAPAKAPLPSPAQTPNPAPVTP